MISSFKIKRKPVNSNLEQEIKISDKSSIANKLNDIPLTFCRATSHKFNSAKNKNVDVIIGLKLTSAFTQTAICPRSPRRAESLSPCPSKIFICGEKLLFPAHPTSCLNMANSYHLFVFFTVYGNIEKYKTNLTLCCFRRDNGRFWLDVYCRTTFMYWMQVDN